MPYKSPRRRAANFKKWRAANPDYDKKRYATNAAYRNKKKRRAKAWRKRNLARARERDRLYRKKHPKPRWLRIVTKQEYAVMLRRQRRRCALCRKPFTKSDPPVLDHSHVTGKARALLHNKCNIGIGHFDDNPVLCRLAAEYLERFSDEKVDTVSHPAEKRKRPCSKC